MSSSTPKDARAKVRPFHCSFCSKVFTRREHLERHIVSHTAHKPYCCEECHMEFSRRDQHANHCRRLHSGQGPVDPRKVGEQPMRIACEACSRSKSSCDKGDPCSRCQKKGIRCQVRNSKRSTKLSQPYVTPPAATSSAAANGQKEVGCQPLNGNAASGPIHDANGTGGFHTGSDHHDESSSPPPIQGSSGPYWLQNTHAYRHGLPLPRFTGGPLMPVSSGPQQPWMEPSPAQMAAQAAPQCPPLREPLEFYGEPFPYGLLSPEASPPLPLPHPTPSFHLPLQYDPPPQQYPPPQQHPPSLPHRSPSQQYAPLAVVSGAQATGPLPTSASLVISRRSGATIEQWKSVLEMCEALGFSASLAFLGPGPLDTDGIMFSEEMGLAADDGAGVAVDGGMDFTVGGGMGILADGGMGGAA
ncbi:hypothetical protein GGS20DRAFT_597251 [Poronia punctata]|nr:hypothetical protein GGS20DRAFT_597251 [Poronia punctata]